MLVLENHFNSLTIGGPNLHPPRLEMLRPCHCGPEPTATWWCQHEGSQFFTTRLGDCHICIHWGWFSRVNQGILNHINMFIIYIYIPYVECMGESFLAWSSLTDCDRSPETQVPSQFLRFVACLVRPFFFSFLGMNGQSLSLKFRKEVGPPQSKGRKG